MACSTNTISKRKRPECSLLPHLSGPKPTLIFCSSNLYPCLVWGNKMGGKLILCQSKLRQCNWLQRGQQPLAFPAADTLKIYTLCVCHTGTVRGSGNHPFLCLPQKQSQQWFVTNTAAHHPPCGPADTWAAHHVCMHGWRWIAWHLLTTHIIEIL